MSIQEITTHFFFGRDILILCCHVLVRMVDGAGTNTQQAFQGVGGTGAIWFFDSLRVLQLFYIEFIPRRFFKGMQKKQK